MKNDVLINRYAEGLAGALRTEEEYKAVSVELGEFAGLLESHDLLRATMLQPFVPAARKTEVLEDILARQGYQDKTRRLILLLAEHGRLDILGDIVRVLPALWNERQGVVTFEVRSVVPLKEGQRVRLEETLRSLERRPVSCAYALDPSIVGGLLVRKGNMIYDVSLKGQLERLKEIIRER
jgi:F-type H+-transporting ATPase subunit delta